MPVDLGNTNPIDPSTPENRTWLSKLRGNILSGHGRDNTIHVFLRLPADQTAARRIVRELGSTVTSAHKQELHRKLFKEAGIPGELFRTLLVSANGYRKLGFDDAALQAAFVEKAAPVPTQSNFLDGMAANFAELGDPAKEQWDLGFRDGNIDLMLLLADDDNERLITEARQAIDQLEAECELVCVERGTALRTDDGEGIEHFGYVDGRSQPLFLTTEFRNLEAGAIGPATQEASGGSMNDWKPFASLGLVLHEDTLASGTDCFGSYFVFRKLEQNVRDFTIAEQRLADLLDLKDEERERAGAMVVGRFRDGSPLVKSGSDHHTPVKANDFIYDGATGDVSGAKCPFQAHIRKTNPRGDTVRELGAPFDDERGHRIARRGIPYGTRNRHPNAFQALDDLPSKDVGLLFMCYQSSIRNQFAFMQHSWANNEGFIPHAGDKTGTDPIIGQVGTPTEDQSWFPTYDDPTGSKKSFFGKFVTMKGGEFFFAPSIPFLTGLN
ncbi:Dyp-type peroxidase [Cupriavidus pampae]|uniref:Multifunctional dye peroxidase DyP2 n=1 Tax=Cupriavidus pampae TaxID=659251 RepID=A0ABM8WYD8_9BURK|nr:Dyp-type peroxidase [Cupriavidus pampae]CAG9172579.1 Multifunctional dye peroxidase DyP2 [Cupriavidus pampae]